jgi:hypothetical protein
MKLYVIYDRAAQEAGPIMECKNDQVAARAFKDAMKAAIAGSEDEFWLYCVGEYDRQTMYVSGETTRVEIAMKGDIEDGR